MARFGQVWLGSARSGLGSIPAEAEVEHWKGAVGFGAVRCGAVRWCLVVFGKVRRGWAWQGVAWCGAVRFGLGVLSRKWATTHYGNGSVG